MENSGVTAWGWALALRQRGLNKMGFYYLQGESALARLTSEFPYFGSLGTLYRISNIFMYYCAPFVLRPFLPRTLSCSSYGFPKKEPLYELIRVGHD